MTDKFQMNKIDLLLKEWSTGNSKVESELMGLLYPEIHKIAHFHVQSNYSKSLQTTEVVNEAFIKLQQQKSFQWKNKSHFLAIASKVMRRVLVDHYRSESALKRGGQESELTLEKVQDWIEGTGDVALEWLNIDYLLKQLMNFDPDAAQVVEYKIFGGLSVQEMSQVMSVSESTILRNWNFAKSWMITKFKSS